MCLEGLNQTVIQIRWLSPALYARGSEVTGPWDATRPL